MKAFRTDVGANITGTMTGIQRTDAALFRGIGELEGQDEYRATNVVDGVGGPKFRADTDRTEALHDHEAMVGDIRTDAAADAVKSARDAMVQRNIDRSHGREVAPVTAPQRVDANESPLEKAKREMNERNHARGRNPIVR